MLVGLGVGVDADDRGGRPRQHLRPVALAAGHVDHAQSRHPRADPLVHRQVALEPVVLDRDVRERALPGELERRHARRLVLLNVDGHWQGERVICGAPWRQSEVRMRSATSTPAITMWPPPRYDSKWGIDFGEIGQAQVLGKLRKVLGSELDRGFERSLEIGAGTGYFSLNLLQAGVVGEATCTDISPGMVRTLDDQRRPPRPRCEGRPCRRRVAAVRRRELRSGARPRRAPPPPRPRPRVCRICARAAPRRPDRVRGRAVEERRPARLAAQARRHRARAAVAGGAPARPAPPELGRRRRRAARRTMVSSASSTSMRSRPGSSRAFARRAGFTEVKIRGEELVANCVRVVQPRARGERRPRAGADAVASVRVPRLPAAAARSTSSVLEPCFRRRCSTTCCWPRGLGRADARWPESAVPRLPAVPARDRRAPRRTRAAPHLRGALQDDDERVPARREGVRDRVAVGRRPAGDRLRMRDRAGTRADGGRPDEPADARHQAVPGRRAPERARLPGGRRASS